MTPNEQAASDDLEPCPFYNLGGRHRLGVGKFDGFWKVCCECGCMGPSHHSAKLAIEAWNRRALLESSPTVPVSGKEQEACEWVHVIPDGIGSWYESSCGLIGDGPNQSWKHCPECGKKINLTVEEAPQ